jgi:prepilin-type N-terminal cleavage/methylation domain-containing protein
MRRSRRRTLGFTLIELLVVVAIIGILAAIAIPNLLEAQVRAKSARAQSDLRTVGTALEMYAVDEDAYPAMTVPGFTGGPPSIAGSELLWWYVPDALSTPVGYLSDANLLCPFGGNYDKAPYFPGEIWKRYGYENIPEMISKADSFPIFSHRYPPEAVIWSGDWRLQCVGPDQLWNPSVAYDPTNGTISGGDIIRTQKSAEGNIGNTYDPWAN